ncbi:MAG: (d)CMP kinase [Coriobacteriia bacterium]|nr:(d)CMP kinase [Coriobacteriia bacterium]
MIIAIDGPAGSGKSTVAKLVAQRLGFHYLDTGAMYRAVAFRVLASGVSVHDTERVGQIAEQCEVSFGHEPGEHLPSRVFIEGEDVTAAIRVPHVDDAVSAVASMPRVRAAMLGQQRRIAAADDIVIEGRDIGTVVFPDAEIKVFLTATPEERSRRRAAQQAASGLLVDPVGVRESMLRRDEADSGRQIAPLVPADDAHVLDTTGLGPKAVADRIVAYFEEPSP